MDKKKTAILLDGAFVTKTFRAANNRKEPTAKEVVDFALSCMDSDEDLLRIYYYDCPPFTESRTHPISKKKIDFGAHPVGIKQKTFLENLSRMEHIAFRSGTLSCSGWKIGDRATKDLLSGKKTGPLLAGDFVPDFKQKRVDIKIGLDIAWLSSKRLVDRVVLVTGDADFIPAMKFARREGVQVVLVTVEKGRLKPEMFEHADLVRPRAMALQPSPDVPPIAPGCP